MTLPTTYTPQSVTYGVYLEGDGVPNGFEIKLETGMLSEARVEALMAGFEPGLQALGEELLLVDDVTAVRIYRSYSGVISGTDIFVP